MHQSVVFIVVLAVVELFGDVRLSSVIRRRIKDKEIQFNGNKDPEEKRLIPETDK